MRCRFRDIGDGGDKLEAFRSVISQQWDVQSVEMEMSKINISIRFDRLLVLT